MRAAVHGTSLDRCSHNGLIFSCDCLTEDENILLVTRATSAEKKKGSVADATRVAKLPSACVSGPTCSTLLDWTASQRERTCLKTRPAP